MVSWGKPEMVTELHGESGVAKAPEEPSPQPELGAGELTLQEFPLEAKSPQLGPRESVDLDSLCGTPFSGTFPETWGHVVELQKD